MIHLLKIYDDNSQLTMLPQVEEQRYPNHSDHGRAGVAQAKKYDHCVAQGPVRELDARHNSRPLLGAARQTYYKLDFGNVDPRVVT